MVDEVLTNATKKTEKQRAMVTTKSLRPVGYSGSSLNLSNAAASSIGVSSMIFFSPFPAYVVWASEDVAFPTYSFSTLESEGSGLATAVVTLEDSITSLPFWPLGRRRLRNFIESEAARWKGERDCTAVMFERNGLKTKEKAPQCSFTWMSEICERVRVLSLSPRNEYL